MLSNYSSLFELIAAVYAAFCFDKVLSDIWNAAYFSKIEHVLEKQDFITGTSVVEHVISKVTDYVEKIKKSTVKKFVFMLSVIMAVFIVVGLEQGLISSNDYNTLERIYIALTISLLYVFIFVLIIGRNYFFKTWKRIVYSFLFFLFIFICSFLFIPVEFYQYKISEFFVENISIIVLGVLLAPIFFQLFFCWIYYSWYLGYITQKIGDLGKEYGLALDLFSSSKGAVKFDDSDVSKDFVKVLIDSARGSLDKDSSMKIYTNILWNKVVSVCSPPPSYTIIFSWICRKFSVGRGKRSYVRVEKKSTSNYEKNGKVKSYKLPNNVVDIDYSNQFDEYTKELKSNPKLNVRSFCKSHNYDCNEMIVWLRKIHPKK